MERTVDTTLNATPSDHLYRKVAKRILTQSLALKKGESLTIEAWNNGLPFARHVALEAVRDGHRRRNDQEQQRVDRQQQRDFGVACVDACRQFAPHHAFGAA